MTQMQMATLHRIVRSCGVEHPNAPGHELRQAGPNQELRRLYLRRLAIPTLSLATIAVVWTGAAALRAPNFQTLVVLGLVSFGAYIALATFSGSSKSQFGVVELTFLEVSTLTCIMVGWMTSSAVVWCVVLGALLDG